MGSQVTCSNAAVSPQSSVSLRSDDFWNWGVGGDLYNRTVGAGRRFVTLIIMENIKVCIPEYSACTDKCPECFEGIIGSLLPPGRVNTTLFFRRWSRGPSRVKTKQTVASAGSLDLKCRQPNCKAWLSC